MYRPLMITPSPEERHLLLEMSKQDMREPWNQVRHLIVAEATRRGLLPVNSNGSVVRQDMTATIAR